jgi:hypothetical protein
VAALQKIVEVTGGVGGMDSEGNDNGSCAAAEDVDEAVVWTARATTTGRARWFRVCAILHEIFQVRHDPFPSKPPPPTQIREGMRCRCGRGRRRRFPLPTAASNQATAAAAGGAGAS